MCGEDVVDVSRCGGAMWYLTLTGGYTTMNNTGGGGAGLQTQELHTPMINETTFIPLDSLFVGFSAELCKNYISLKI